MIRDQIREGAMRAFESLPQWNNEWDPTDPLRGKRGWAFHHYVSLVAGLAVLAATLWLVWPVAAKSRQRAEQLDQDLRQLHEVMEKANVPGSL
jgi:hypothetical protein